MSGTTGSSSTTSTPVTGPSDHTIHAGGGDPIAATSTVPFADLLALIDAPEEGFTPEMIVQMAARRLSSIDSEIQTAMHQMDATGSRLAELRAATQAISDWRAANHGSTTAEFDMGKQITITLPNGSTQQMSVRGAMEAAGMDTSAITGVDAAHHDDIKDANLQDVADAIKAQLDSVNQGSDVNQLQLQQLVNSRGQITQLASQLIAALHDTDKAILQNTHS